MDNKFEFKFLIKEGNNIARWEEGMNHIYDFQKCLDKFSQPEIVKHLSSYDEIEIESEKDKIAYNKKTRLFVIHTLWQSSWFKVSFMNHIKQTKLNKSKRLEIKHDWVASPSTTFFHSGFSCPIHVHVIPA